MNAIEAADILRKHNEWRRDDDGLIETHSPKLIGEAIDLAVEYITRSVKKGEQA